MQEQNKIIIPEGWTYFVHRSNTDRWKINPLEASKIDVNPILNVITEADLYGYIRAYGKTSTKGFNLGKGKPFEIRCLITDLKHVRSMDDSLPIKNIMLHEFYFDRNNYGGCAGQRHHSIPKGEELVVLAIGNYDEVYECDANIIWVIPRRFISFYEEEIKKGNYRTIDINKIESKER